MANKITIQVRVENTAFSFETDGSGAGIQDAIESIQKITRTYGRALESIGSKSAGKDSKDSPITTVTTFSVEDLELKAEILDRITDNIRKVSYWDLVLTILAHGPSSLTYNNLMSISKMIGKPISYDWLNTEFHRKKYRGLVRSEDIPGSKEKTYSITEVGRKRVDSFLEELQSLNNSKGK